MWTATERLYAYVHTEQFKRDVLHDTDKITRFGIGKVLTSRIENQVTSWHRQNIKNIFLETFLERHGERFRKIHEKLHIIKNGMQGIKTPFTDYPRIATALVSSIGSSGIGIIGGLAISGLLLSPYLAVGVAAAGIAHGALSASLVLFDIPDDFDIIRDRTFTKIIHNLSRERIKKEMRSGYENEFKTIINAFIEEEIQVQIDNLNRNVDIMLKNLDDYRKQKAVLLSLESEVHLLWETVLAVADRKIRST